MEKRVSSKATNFLQLLSRYTTGSAQKRKVPKRKGEYLFGVAPCFAALQQKRRKVYNIFLKEGVMADRKRPLKKAAVLEVQRYAQKHRVDIHRMDSNTMERLSGNRPHQGMVLDAEPLNFRQMDLKDCKISVPGVKKSPVWLALDEIQDPMNFGAILRCGFFLGVDRFIVTAKNWLYGSSDLISLASCRLSPVVSKASAGAMELMPVYSVKSMTNFLQDAAENGWHILGTCSSDTGHQQNLAVPIVSCSNYTLQGPTILVLGNEAYGLHRTVEKACTTLLTIEPLRTLPLGFDSLNVGVATGILLYNLQRNHH